jgi:hypothetical protein
MPAITRSTISKEDSQIYDWLSELEKEGHRLADANAGEVGLEWLASNRMLFYALQVLCLASDYGEIPHTLT